MNPDDIARQAENFEALNAPQMRRDAATYWLITLRPVLWLLLAVGLTLLGLHVFSRALALAAQPVFLGY
jgi:hypothetical protein